jgi:two-component system, cell cycle sensor histidine kinase PleC
MPTSIESRRNAGGRSETQVVDGIEDTRAGARQWQHDLLVLFVRNQLRVSLALPMIAVLFALVSLSWTTPLVTGAWLSCVLACQGVQLWLCRQHQLSDGSAHSHAEWTGNLTASETLVACCWALPLYLFWEPGNYLQHIALIGALLVVIAIRIMIAGNFVPVVIAGTGFITLNIVIRCFLEADLAYVTLAGIAVLTEIFFIQLSRRLQDESHDMLIFKAERERLIGELRDAMDQTEAARARAEEASQAKSRFLATMSHELRTPLNAIMGFSEVLSTEMMGPHAVSAYKDYSHDIHHSGHYLLSLINDILDLSRIEAGRLEIEDEAVNVGRIGRDCAKLTAMRIEERGQQLRQNFPVDEPMILGGERSVRQIWLNLCPTPSSSRPPAGPSRWRSPCSPRARWRCRSRTTGRAFPPTRWRRHWARLPAAARRPARPSTAPASACRSSAASPSSTAPNSPSTARRARAPKSSSLFPPPACSPARARLPSPTSNVKSPSQRRLIAVTS